MPDVRDKRCSVAIALKRFTVQISTSSVSDPPGFFFFLSPGVWTSISIGRRVSETCDTTDALDGRLSPGGSLRSSARCCTRGAGCLEYGETVSEPSGHRNLHRTASGFYGVGGDDCSRRRTDGPGPRVRTSPPNVLSRRIPIWRPGRDAFKMEETIRWDDTSNGHFGRMDRPPAKHGLSDVFRNGRATKVSRSKVARRIDTASSYDVSVFACEISARKKITAISHYFHGRLWTGICLTLKFTCGFPLQHTVYTVERMNNCNAR